jgi:hypothetical protein
MNRLDFIKRDIKLRQNEPGGLKKDLRYFFKACKGFIKHFFKIIPIDWHRGIKYKYPYCCILWYVSGWNICQRINCEFTYFKAAEYAERFRLWYFGLNEGCNSCLRCPLCILRKKIYL